MLDSIPRGGWSRARATARLGLSSARLLVASRAGRERLAESLLAELDGLKGMAMKVGQILSYMDVGLPPEVVARLERLQTGVQPMAWATLQPVVEAELGGPLDRFFLSLDDEPVAAASIGQVHRGRWRDGRDVACKVRYPGVRETMDEDFALLGRLGGIAGRFSAVDGRALVAELQARIHEECDYRAEAAWQERFAAFFRQDEDIVVPAVVEAREGVLISSWVDSAPARPADRERHARALMRFTFAPLFERGWLHADPHPGNRLIDRQGRLVALDFGCMRSFPMDWVADFRRLVDIVTEGRRPALPAALAALGLAPRPDRIDFDEEWAMMRWMFAPLVNPPGTLFPFSRSWWLEGRRFARPTAPNARHRGFPPEWLWIQRVVWGLWAVLVPHDQPDP